MNYEEYKRLHFNVAKMQKEYPDYSTCAKCGLPWAECTPHSVTVIKLASVFAVCSHCWEHSDLQTIKECHKEVFYQQREQATKHNITIGYNMEHLMKCIDSAYAESKK